MEPPAPQTADPRMINAVLGAAKDNDVVTLSSLLSANASPDTANTIDQSALHIASMWGSLDAVRLLLAAGANVNAVNRFGASPLHCAAQRNQVETGRYLIENGADVNLCAGNRMRAFEMCPEPDSRPAFGKPRTELHEAARGVDAAAALQTLLASQTIALDGMDDEGEVALAIVAKRADEGACGILLSHGADPSVLCRSGLSPLHIAVRAAAPDPPAASGAADEPVPAYEQFVAVAAQMLGSGRANPNQFTRSSSEYGSGDWERREAFGQLSTVSDVGKACLHLAVEGCAGRTEMVSLLLEHAADVNAREGEAEATALHLALEAEHDAVCLLLLQAGADVHLGNRDSGLENTPLHNAAQRGSLSHVRMLIDARADVNRPGRAQMRPLHIAARTGTVEVVRSLVEADADLEARDARNKLAIEYAQANKKQGAVLEYLTTKMPA